MITSYQKLLIYKATQIRMEDAKEKELNHLAESMEIPIGEVRKIYDEEAKSGFQAVTKNE